MNGFVYFAKCGDEVKIGYSTDVRKRVESLAIGNAARIEIIGVVAGEPWLEGRTHARLSHLRKRGEWFADCDELRRVLAEMGGMALPDRVPKGKPDTSDLRAAVAAVRGALGRHAAKRLARITGQDPKTSHRQIKNGRPPSGEAVFLMATDPATAPALLVVGARRLKPEDHRKYWSGVALVALNALRAPTSG